MVTLTEYRSGGTTGGSPSVSYATEIWVKNAKNQERREFYNARGELIEVRDAAGSTEQSTTRYTYDVFGNLLTTRVNGVSGTTITNTFDIRGRKRTMDDPDLSPGAAVWTFFYTAFGEEVREQIDAKGQVTQFTYDTLGRLTQRIDAVGTGNAVTTTFTFDAATNGKGKLASSSSSEGETKTFTFDSQAGRLQTTTTAISGEGSYVTRQDFDSVGRLEKITYPVSTAFPSGLRVRYDYNPHGYLSEVRNDNAGATFNALYWQLNEQTAEGQLKRATFGNNVTTEHDYVAQTGMIALIRSGIGTSGPWAVQHFEYDFDVLGNLTRREDRNQLVRERLSNPDSYDALNRVRTVRRYTGPAGSETLAATRTIAYDALGNLTSKSHMTGSTPGGYDYATAATCTGVSGQVAPGPHAVRRITAGSARHFCYDGNGNQLRGWNFTTGQIRDLTWTPYNKPKTITEDGQTLTFSYGADRSRFKQVNSFTGETRLYVDGLYEKETVGVTVTHVHYIAAAGQAVAIYKSRSDSVQETLYLHRDHLGNVTEITDHTATVVERLSYDLWGKRRNTDWSDASEQLYSDFTPRGFTGHEHLDRTTLIHMNGRVYDPNTARMLSPDPFVQFAGYSQSFNRYSYVLNNPLAFVDPSGYCVAGAACPTSGLASFSPGLGGSIASGRMTFGSLSSFVVASSFLRVPTFSFGHTFGSAGGGCTYTNSSGCGPWMMTFGSDFGFSVSNFFAAMGSWFTSASSTVYVYVYPDLETPDGHGGALTAHHQAAFEQKFGGRTHSPMLQGLASPQGGQSVGAEMRPVSNPFAILGQADIPGLSRTLRLFDATFAPLVGLGRGLFTGDFTPSGPLTGFVPTHEELTTSGIVAAGTGIAGVSRAAIARAAPHAFTRTHGLAGRASSRNVDDIAASMRVNGWQGPPISVLEHNGARYILDGHHRVVAARRVGIDVPYRTVAPQNLRQFGYESVEQVIDAATRAGPVRLR